MQLSCAQTEKMTIYGSIITSLFYRNSKNVEVVVVRGYRRIYKRGLVFIVRNKHSAFHALAYDVDDDREINILDKMEGHPRTYERTCIEVERLNGELIPSWIYVPTPRTLTMFGISTYKDDLDDCFIENIKISGATKDFPLLAEKPNK